MVYGIVKALAVVLALIVASSFVAELHAKFKIAARCKKQREYDIRAQKAYEEIRRSQAS